MPTEIALTQIASRFFIASDEPSNIQRDVHRGGIGCGRLFCASHLANDGDSPLAH
jgi:hypothetical protein